MNIGNSTGPLVCTKCLRNKEDAIREHLALGRPCCEGCPLENDIQTAMRYSPPTTSIADVEDIEPRVAIELNTHQGTTFSTRPGHDQTQAEDVQIQQADHNRIDLQPTHHETNRIHWLVFAIIMLITYFLYIRYHDDSSSTQKINAEDTEAVQINVLSSYSDARTNSDASASTLDGISKQPVHPIDLCGLYSPRMMNGNTNVRATVKIEKNDRIYLMRVFSSAFTRQFTFTYNSSTGEIKSDELGKGMARIKKTINQTEIIFEGWKLVN